LVLRQQERVLEELRLVRSDIGDLRTDMEVQSAIIGRLDQSVQSLTGEVRGLVVQQDRERQRLEPIAGLGGADIGQAGMTVVAQHGRWRGRDLHAEGSAR
jgi:hypothetical protein